MKPLWVNRKGTISEGEFKGKEGMVVGFDSTIDKATIQFDDITFVEISSDYIEQVEDTVKVKAFDINGTEIKPGDIVKVIKKPYVNHGWLRVGNTLRVDSWEDRTLGTKDFICVFLKSKKGGKHCRLGVQDKLLMVVEGVKKNG